MFLTLMMKLYVQLQLFVRRREGATAIEYVILVAIVALVILAAGTDLGTRITNFFTRVGTAIGS